MHQQAVQEVSTIANTQEGGGSSFDSAKGSLDTFVADDMVSSANTKKRLQKQIYENQNETVAVFPMNLT